MHHNMLSIPAIINILIIVFVFKTFISKFSKQKPQNKPVEKKQEQPTTDKFELFLDKQIQVTQPPVQKVVKATQKIHKDTTIKATGYEYKPIDKDKLVLKRCANCGGEIPLSMMKCSICGTRQPGLGFLIVFVFFMAAIFVIAILSSVFHFNIQVYIDKLIELL